jgi:hypothetical protein
MKKIYFKPTLEVENYDDCLILEASTPDSIVVNSDETVNDYNALESRILDDLWGN